MSVHEHVEECLRLFRRGRFVLDHVAELPRETITHWQEAASAGNSKAIWLSGLALEAGVEGAPEVVAAFEQYSKAAEAGFAPARFWAALSCLDGRGVEADAPEAARRFELLAAEDDALAEVALGICLLYGSGVAPDPSRATELFRRAAESHGNPDGDFQLGLCYLDGVGVPQDSTSAVEHFRRAAEEGHIGAQAALGECYLDGDGVAKNSEQAVEWLSRAAEFHHPTALLSLSACYELGDGVAKDTARSLDYLEQAANAGDAGAQYLLGLDCEQGRRVSKNLDRALEYLEASAAQGNSDAPRAARRVRWKLDGGEAKHAARPKTQVAHRIVRVSEASPRPDPDLRALSLRQPWAELVLQGRKTIEVRSSRTKVRGRVYIYAGQKRLDPFDEFERVQFFPGTFAL